MKMRTWIAAVGIGSMLTLAMHGLAQEPPLPEGLDQPKADSPATAMPPLPEGLGEPALPAGPPLPEGLGESAPPSSPSGPALPEGLEAGAPAPGGDIAPGDVEAEPPLLMSGLLSLQELTGFWEIRAGLRTQDSPHEEDMSIGETRLQLDYQKFFDEWSLNLTSDFLYDWVGDNHEIDLEEGEGWVDLREANVAFTPLDFMDVKVGRQILTWGTGDLIFINDLFPKDYVSFFIGRDEEYLKAPSDAVRVSFFTDPINLNVVYVPRFDADRYITGERISYYHAGLDRIVGQDVLVDAEKPDSWFADDEWHVRAYRNLDAYEVALYGYKGYWKSPAGLDPLTGEATFPRLAVYGASIRGPFAKGIANGEFGYYDSLDDRDGDDPFVRNSELRFLVGYEQELFQNFTAAMQYYLEYMLHHDRHLRSLPRGAKTADQDRHVLTWRLTWLTMSQNLEWSLFTFYSPSDEDAYLRPKVHYKIDDHWAAEIGGNVFLGRHDHTFFGQFEDNSNVYVALRYGF